MPARPINQCSSVRSLLYIRNRFLLDYFIFSVLNKPWSFLYLIFVLIVQWPMPFYLKIFFNFYILFIYLFLAALSLCCCAQVLSSCGEWGLLFVVVCGLLIAVASCCRARAPGVWAPGMRASVVVAHGLSSCGSRALERRLSSCGAQA